MFGGGEEYFQDPPAIDGDTLRHFAAFCARLRRVEKPGKKAIHEATLLARAVGDTLQSYELVIGALLRHIKTWTGNQQLACWYVLDKLCKEDRDKYGYVASKYILDIGRDYIPYEDPVLAPKYESLVEHWESVFSRHVVDTLWTAKKERLWAVSHPQEVLAQQSAEEAAWEAEEREMEDESGLNHFGQPCMDYLQGRCSWGENCRLLHPPGEEGSLPPECRMGDWKCGFCGAINRHFRRRCSNCVQEKKQYKRDRIASLEDRLLSSPDAAVGLALRQQFGYDPNLREEAIAHWKLRLGTCTHDEYMAERRAAYKTRILGQPATTPLEVRCQTQKHFGDAVVGAEAYVAIEGGEGAAKRARTEDSSLVPSGTPAPAAVAMLCQVVVERGIRDTRAPAIFSELTQWVRRIAGPNATPFNPSQSEVLVNAAKLAFTAWSASKESVPFVVSFFRALRGARLHTAGFSTLQEEQLNAMASDFL